MARVTITKYSRGIKVTTGYPCALDVIKNFNRGLKQPKINKERGRVFVTEGENFYAYNKRENAYYYISGLLGSLLDEFEKFNVGHSGTTKITVDFVDIKPTEGRTVDFKNHTLNLIEPEDSPFVEQNDVIRKAIEESRDHAILEVQTGRGKALANNTPVRVPGGWKNMGDIRVGDKVIAPDGTATDVIGHYPQGKVPLYDITFADGRTVTCCGEHLWKVYYVNTTKNRRWRVVNTLEVLRYLNMSKPRVYIELCEPEIGNDKTLPIDPYLLGAIIGDGNISGRGVRFSTPDTFIIDELTKLLPDELKFVQESMYDWRITSGVRFYGKNILRSVLDDLGLVGKSETKFIPDTYKTASSRQKLALLQGLMDTDGTVNKDGGQPSFNTTSKELAKDVVEIARSLGMIAKLSPKPIKYPYRIPDNVKSYSYNVSFRCKKPSDLFRLPRKKELTRDGGQYVDTLKLRVSSIVRVEDGEASCITVNHPEALFVCKDYIVTHNTAMGQKILISREKRAMIITKAAYVDKWKGDLTEKKNSLSLKPGELIVVKGVSAMNDLIEMGRDGDLDSGKGRRVNKVILVSSNTFELWMKEVLSGAIAIDPTEVLEILKVGTVLYDESHQFFRMNYVSFLLLNPSYVIDLSATLIPRQTDEFAKSRYRERFPPLSRIEMEYVKYIEALSIYYHTGNKELLRRINRMKMYNHIEFEKFIMKRKPLIAKYFDMIAVLLEKFYVANYQKGQKALVFFASQHMCTAFVEYIKERLPDFDVQRNIQGDNYKKFVAADIGVSTPGKSGTAVDIPGLIFSVVSVAIGKEDTNLQILGRTRQDRTWGLKPKVIFLHCEEFRKHIDYLNVRRKVFENRVESFKILNSGFNL